MIATLQDYWPHQFRRYFEPFLGGGSVLLNFMPRPAYVSDLNVDLINTFGWVKRDIWNVIMQYRALEQRYLTASDKARENLYYETRSRFLLLPDRSSNRAAHFLFLNRTCFNGLWRVNRKGDFNVPHGRLRTVRSQGPLIPDWVFLEANQRLKGVRLSASDFRPALDEVARGDFVYLDPPYSSPNARLFHEYQQHGFPFALQEEVADEASYCFEKGAQVLVSNAADDAIRALYEARGFFVEVVSARRSINAVVEGRGGHKELICLSPNLIAEFETRRLL
jgi:DNA adenine methylase